MNKRFSRAVSQHALDQCALDVRAARDDAFVDVSPTSSTVLPDLSEPRPPRSVFRSWLELGQLPVLALCVVVMTLVLWTGVSLASISALITALIFLIVLGFYRALRVTDLESVDAPEPSQVPSAGAPSAPRRGEPSP